MQFEWMVEVEEEFECSVSVVVEVAVVDWQQQARLALEEEVEVVVEDLKAHLKLTELVALEVVEEGAAFEQELLI